MTNQNNRLAMRSKRRLTNAFFALIKEQPQKKIQIKELCKRAGISRPTFYSHYDIVEDILREYLEACLQKQIRLVQKKLDQNLSIDTLILDTNLLYFEFWEEHIDLYDSIKNAGLGYIVLEKTKDLMHFAYHNIGRQIDEIDDSEVEDFFISHLTSTLYQLLGLWVKTKMRRTSDEMAEMMILFIPPDILPIISKRFKA